MARVEVELALDRLDVAPAEVARLRTLLDPAEIDRADRFRHDLHRTRFVVRRARLRQWLGRQLGLAPDAVRIATDAMGKPCVPGWDRHFSTSHSRDTMLIAGAAVRVGCDIEAIATDFDWRPVAERLFAAEESEALAAMADAPGRIAFFHCWARKEAFVKALGLGLSHPLDAFAVSVSSPPVFVRGGEGWSMAAIELPGFALAVAAEAGGTALQLVLPT
jgi:4'-phosphopantetheinyl transferase